MKARTLSEEPKPSVDTERARLVLSDCRDAIHWFRDSALAYQGSVRGLLASDFTEEHDAVLEAAMVGLKARGISPLVLTGEALYQGAEYLWDLALKQTTFGRPAASKFELDISGADVLVVKDLEAPENARQLWYLYHYVFYPRAFSNKPTVIATPLSYEEFIMYGAGCEDFEYGGRKITWEKVLWLLNATSVDLHHFRHLNGESMPIMLMAEYALYMTLKRRGLDVKPHHIVGDHLLDLAIVDKQNKLNIECDLFSAETAGSQAAQAKRNLLLVGNGWKVLRFTTTEILSNIGACADAVEDVWKQGIKKSPVGTLLSGQAATVLPELPEDDEGQRFAIMHVGGPAAIAGGAGTGKTSCLLKRIALLLARGANPERILLIGYSSETVRQLKEGLEKTVEKQTAQKVNVYTWHDLGLKILKENLSAIRRKPPLKNEANPQKIIQKLLSKYKKELDPATLDLSEELDELTVSSLISLYKANLVTHKHVKERCQTPIDELVAKVYLAYEEHLQRSNRIDRDDMVSLAAQLLADQPDIRTRYQYQYDHVLVDDYQDATAAGDLMARLLAFPQDSIYVAGDEDEAISETKGGLPRLIADISLHLPNARGYILEQNWRCHPQVVEHAQELARHLKRRKMNKVTRSGWGTPPESAIMGPIALSDEHAEAERVADEIQLLLDGGRKPTEIAVLYRYHRFALIIEEALSRRGVRCLASHPDSGLLPDEVGDVMAFVKLVMDPDGPKAREAFERICQFKIREIDPKLSATIASFAEQNNLSYLKAVEIYAEAVPELACKELAQLVKVIRSLNQDKMPPAETIAFASKTLRLKDFYSTVKVPTGVNYEPLRAVSQLQEEARKHKTVSEFVKSYSSTRQAEDLADSRNAAINVLTLSEAKGREFMVVFMVGLAEGLFPAGASSDREEERRLCYVGMTRARELLYLSYPQTFNEVALAPSSFLLEARLLSKVPARAQISPETAVAPTAQPVIQKPKEPTPKAASVQSIPAVSVQPVTQPKTQSKTPTVSHPVSTSQPKVPPPAKTTPTPGLRPAVTPPAAAPPPVSVVPPPAASSPAVPIPSTAQPAAQAVPKQPIDKPAPVTAEIEPVGPLPAEMPVDVSKVSPPVDVQSASAASSSVADAVAPNREIVAGVESSMPGSAEEIADVSSGTPEDLEQPVRRQLNPMSFAELEYLKSTVKRPFRPPRIIEDPETGLLSLYGERLAAHEVPPATTQAPTEDLPSVNASPGQDLPGGIEVSEEAAPAVTSPVKAAVEPWLPASAVPAQAWESDAYSPAQPNGSGNNNVGQPSAASVKCQSCGAVNESDSKFCGECGTLVQGESTIPSCHMCGAPMEGGAKFCGECGSKQVKAAPPPAAPKRSPAPAGSVAATNATAYLGAMHGGSAVPPTQRGWVLKLLKLLE